MVSCQKGRSKWKLRAEKNQLEETQQPTQGPAQGLLNKSWKEDKPCSWVSENGEQDSIREKQSPGGTSWERRFWNEGGSSVHLDPPATQASAGRHSQGPWLYVHLLAWSRLCPLTLAAGMQWPEPWALWSSFPVPLGGMWTCLWAGLSGASLETWVITQCL